jgi:hypothetical protein
MALREMDRKARLKEFFKTGLGWTTKELKNAIDLWIDNALKQIPRINFSQESATPRTPSNGSKTPSGKRGIKKSIVTFSSPKCHIRGMEVARRFSAFSCRI